MRDTVTASRGADRSGPAAAIALVSLATIATVWWLEMRGYTPCELCLKERVPYYIALPLAGALALAGRRLPGTAREAGLVLRTGYILLVLLWVGSLALGVYHTGVEWKLWAGPSECSGAASAPAAVGDFLNQLRTVTVVRCDEAALQAFGLSLAAWNALLSAALAGLAVVGLRRNF